MRSVIFCCSRSPRVPPVLDSRVGRRFQPRVEGHRSRRDLAVRRRAAPFARCLDRPAQLRAHQRRHDRRRGCRLTPRDGRRGRWIRFRRCGRLRRRLGRRWRGRRILWRRCRRGRADSRRWCWCRYLHRRRSGRRRCGFRLAGRRRGASRDEDHPDNRGDDHERRDRQRTRRHQRSRGRGRLDRL